MAETEVRRRPLVWPWIVGLTVVAVLVWLLAERLAGEPDAAEQVRTPPVSGPASGPVQMA